MKTEQKKDVKRSRHSRVLLSGIFNAARDLPSVLKRHNVEDPRVLRTATSGMTPLFNRGAFTLIELLVVVLIIGILSAIALPQYQKAVAKTRYTQLVILGRSLLEAQKIYYLANGSYAPTFEELDMVPPGTLSTDKKTVTGTNYQCYFNAPYNEFACLSSGLPSLLVYYAADRIDCRAYDDFEKKLCISLGGVFRNKDTSAGYTNYTLYKQ